MRVISPIISTDWLEDHITEPKLVILDIRIGREYEAGHIPRAINIPFPDAVETPYSQWYVERDGLILEMPEEAELFKTIGSAGIKSDSLVAVVSEAALPHPLVDATRVADILIWAGVKNAVVLDGGYQKWLSEGRATSPETVEPVAVTYTGKLDGTVFVGKEYVREKIGQAVIVDTRESIEYFGGSIRPLWVRPGHIPTAKCLPTLWLWKEDFTYRGVDELRGMASGVVGEDTDREVILYCGVGGFSSAWYFILTEVLGYKDVKIYHGSAQEWTRDPEAPLVVYKWE